MPRFVMLLVVLVMTVLFFVTASARAAAPGSAPEAVVLWPLPGGAPGAQGTTDADTPTLYIHRPAKDKANGAAVVICPGGGYGAVMMSYEGHEVADWFTSFGVTGVVLRYRLAPKYHHPAPQQDVYRAIRVIRSRAADLGLDPARIGVMGFSAGGHLAASAATTYPPVEADAKDPIDRVASRPDFAILAYPVISMGKYTHGGSRRNLIGDKPDDDPLVQQMSIETRVTKDTPPTFLFHTRTDQAVPVQNSLLYYEACLTQGVPAEIHIYNEGPHGVGLFRHASTKSWPEQARLWMENMGLFKSK